MDEANSAPAGRYFAGTRADASVSVEPGSTLLLSSDGLVERRQENMDDGLSRLGDAAASLVSTDLDAMPNQLIGMLTSDQSPADDIITVAARWEPLADRFHRRFIADTGALAPLRADLRNWLERHAIQPAALADITLAVGEGITNAVEHAYLDQPVGEVSITIDRRGGALEVRIRDHGVWRRRRAHGNRGRGLAIMSAIATHLDRSSTDDGTELTLQLAAPVIEPDNSP